MICRTFVWEPAWTCSHVSDEIVVDLMALLPYCVAMYIESVRNRNSPPAILLRESYRDGKSVRKRTLLNLSNWAPEHVEGLRGVLKGGVVVPAGLEALTVQRSLPQRPRRGCAGDGPRD